MAERGREALPRFADTVIVGGGTSGAVVAGRLAEGSDRSILVLEAGPDYGALAAGRWPPALLDARTLPRDAHDWLYTSTARHGPADLPLSRARVIGGCSSHNGCAAIWGSRRDYDGWEALGNPGWGTDDLLPLFRAADQRMRVRTPGAGEITPFHQAILDAAPGAGLPVVENLNDLDQDVGVAPSPVNVWRGRRWNAALAYLDPVRERSHLAIHGDVLVDRLIIEHGRVRAVAVIGPDGPARIETEQVIVCAGAYGSPAVLLRSGIGDADDLRALGIAPVHSLPGVGHNLHDHPALTLHYAGTPALIAAMERFREADGWLCEEQTIAKARSSRCETAFDLHLYPVGSPYWLEDGSWLFQIPVANMAPLSRGTLRLLRPDPDAPPTIDHGYLTDLAERDLAILLDGVALARNLVRQSPLAELIGPETVPGPAIGAGDALRAYVRAQCVHYYHPVGTCTMGPASDPSSVVDSRGRVHGLEGVLVADASIMPVVPRANTNMPCVVIGEKIARLVLEDS